MAISEELLEILVCPETKQDLTPADKKTIDILNEKIQKGVLKNRAGETVKGEVNGALIRKDNKYLYLIREDIPVMLIDEAISTDDLK